MTRILAAISIAFLLFGLGQAHAAGFGITPPYLKNDSLARGSTFAETIYIVREDPVEDLDAKITTNVPGADNWISVDRGNDFILSQGQQQVPIKLQVKIPANAGYGTYAGNIRIVVSPKGGPQAGTVGITLGAQIDVGLKVTDVRIFDFAIHGIKVYPAEEGYQILWLHFPGKISFDMSLENKGNIPAAPTKVVFDIYSAGDQTKVLETTQNINSIKKVSPYGYQTVTAELPTLLPAGSYTAAYRIFKNNDVVQQGMIDLAIMPKGSVPGYKGYGIEGLKLQDQLTLLAILIVLLGGIFFLVRKILKRRK